MSARAERMLLAAVVALAPEADREALAGDLLEAAAESRTPGALGRELVRSLPALIGWRIARLGARPLVLAALAGLAAAVGSLVAVSGLWHAVLSAVPRRAGHAMPVAWICVDGALAALAGMVGARFGAGLGQFVNGGRTR